MPKKLENVYVCNEHFAYDCFKTQYRFELVAGNTRRRSLKKNANSDNFSTEGPCKGTYCKRTAHRKERKEVAINYTFHF